jgi:hypothetical protein
MSKPIVIVYVKTALFQNQVSLNKLKTYNLTNSHQPKNINLY